MNKQFIATVLSSLFVFTPLAQAAEPTQEPSHGIVRGRDLEWSAPHLQYHIREEAHREYHRQMEIQLNAWLSANADERGLRSYADDYRLLRARLNFEHRMAHEFEKNAAEAEALAPAAQGGMEPVIEVAAPLRTYERKSRRQIILEQEQNVQEQMDARGL